MIAALLPPLLALPLFALGRHIDTQRISSLFIGLWVLSASVWLLGGGDFFLYLAGWFIWGALFLYLATWGEDDGPDFWEYDPEGPWDPAARKPSKYSPRHYTPNR